MQKILLFGAGGQLGVELRREFERRGHTVIPFDRQTLDITKPDDVESTIAKAEPQIVVNSAAYNQVDIAEREPKAAFEVNALAVRNLAVACRSIGAKLVHYSTDYVFDGTKGSPYTEEDGPHPIGAYGVSKLTGEFFARAYLSEPLIIRVSGVFGPAGMFTPRGNFVESMLRLGRESRPIRVVQDHIASPTYAPYIATRTADLLDRREDGIFHMGGGEAISWYDYARMIFEEAGVNPSLQPTDETEYRTAARRPKFSALRNARLEAIGTEPLPPLRQAVKEYMGARQNATAHR